MILIGLKFCVLIKRNVLKFKERWYYMILIGLKFPLLFKRNVLKFKERWNLIIGNILKIAGNMALPLLEN